MLYVLVIVTMLAAGEPQVGVFTKDGKMLGFKSKEDCTKFLSVSYDEQIKSDPSKPFAMSCMTPDQLKAVLGRIAERKSI